VRRHAQGYVRGEEWSPLPPEADLGLDRRLKADETEKDERPKPIKARSRSHSLVRVMQELDDGVKVEGDPQEAEGMVETCGREEQRPDTAGCGSHDRCCLRDR